MRIEENHTNYLKEDYSNTLIEDKSVCPICDGIGEVTTMEAVYPDEPHIAPIGSRKCVCQLIEEDEYDPDIE